MVIWDNSKEKSEFYQQLLRDTIFDMILYNKIDHPLFKNFFVEWIEGLQDNISILYDLILNTFS